MHARCVCVCRGCRQAKEITDAMAQTELAGMLLAGHEALGQSFAWAMQLLAAHPKAQASDKREAQSRHACKREHVWPACEGTSVCVCLCMCVRAPWSVCACACV